MQRLLRLSRAIDRMNDVIGRGVYWLTLAMVLVAAFNSIARYLGRFTGVNLSSNAYLETQWYLFSIVFLLGAAYTLRHDGHVRVDVIFARLSPKHQAWIDLTGTVLFLIPFCILMFWVSLPSVEHSWAVMEVSPDPGGLPRYPIKTLIPVTFVLLILQAFSMVIRNVAIVRGVSVEPEPPHTEVGRA
ncbi:MAG: TRAP transporter small permease subunit [Rhodothermales bacterium]|jgi:TRAP-type mannitol/chloroaromatic compound transport system permease small subunit